MPFDENWIINKIRSSREADRLAHAFLLTGSDIAALERLALRVAEIILDGSPQGHPDFHCVRPESKSRRLTIAQMRVLEHNLQLKSHRGGLKVGLVIAADRMCLGQAEAANAFLKTLEEPPAHTHLLLVTDRPGQLLPTIRSRCVGLPLLSSDDNGPSANETEWIEHWLAARMDSTAASPSSPIARAYLRSQILMAWWNDLRSSIEATSGKDSSDEDATGETLKAQLESEYLLARDHTLALLIRAVWNHRKNSEDSDQKGNIPQDTAAVICQTLEELRSALQRNVDASLALERCHLKMAGALDSPSSAAAR